MKILFVCTGNICRSPLAEGILKAKLGNNNIPAYIDSCGFESFHVGDQPDERAQKVARKRGINISDHLARIFSITDFDRFDRIYVMDHSHYNKLMKLARHEYDRNKVDYIMNSVHPGENLPVNDPWYDDMHAFEMVFDQLDNACDKIAMVLRHQPKDS